MPNHPSDKKTRAVFLCKIGSRDSNLKVAPDIFIAILCKQDDTVLNAGMRLDQEM
jgi:hypothetical protein